MIPDVHYRAHKSLTIPSTYVLFRKKDRRIGNMSIKKVQFFYFCKTGATNSVLQSVYLKAFETNYMANNIQFLLIFMFFLNI